MRNWSPEQIRDDLTRSFPNRPEMHVSHETTYQSLFVQGRGHLRADLHKHLCTGRALRRHRGEPRRASWSKIRDMTSTLRVTGEDCLVFDVPCTDAGRLEQVVDSLAGFGPVSTALVLRNYPDKPLTPHPKPES